MKYTKIFSFLLLVAFTSACSESFLEVKSLDEKNTESYYATPADANEGLVGCYDALQLIWSEGVAFPLASDVMSDLCFGGTGAGDNDAFPMMDEFDASRSPGDVNMFEGNWKNYYKGIFRVNSLLQGLPNVDWDGDEAKGKAIAAEARFLRAFFYFDMVRMFGRVPLLTEPSRDNVPQSEPDEIYAVIADDLLYAIENGISTPYGQIADADYGHANKWAAKALLARVYLYYTGYYGKPDLVGKVSKAEALAGLEDVISTSGHALVANYSELWPAAATSAAADAGKPITEAVYAGETNAEVVFAIKYTYTSDYNGNTDGNHWMVMNGLRGKSWANRGYGNGWGGATVPTEVYKNWSATDTRRTASIMAIAEEKITYDASDVKEYTGYITKKYIPTCDAEGNSLAANYGAVNFMIGQFQDFFSIRYSDVLLMAAELGSANALDYVNQVHTRAGLPALATVNKDVIYEERKNEFAFEGIRYWDLLRYDSTLAYAADKIAYSGTVSTGGTDVAKTITKEKLLLTKGLFQIPYNQINLSGNVLTQNPGW